MSEIRLKDKTLEYEVIHKRNKKMYLRVKEGKLFITAPYLTSIRNIENFILEHEDWINKQLLSLNTRPIYTIEDNKRVKIISNMYTIKYDSRCDIDEEYVYLRSETAYEDFLFILESKLKSYCKNKFEFYFDAMNLDTSFPSINYKNLKSQHGHYNKLKHEITLSISLALLDEELIDYVIVHELAHIKYFNHQEEFYNFIESVMPNYKTIIKRLRKEGVNV